jgi:hypothetical protein
MVLVVVTHRLVRLPRPVAAEVVVTTVLDQMVALAAVLRLMEPIRRLEEQEIHHLPLLLKVTMAVRLTAIVRVLVVAAQVLLVAMVPGP